MLDLLGIGGSISSLCSLIIQVFSKSRKPNVKISVGQANQLRPIFKVVIENRRETDIVVQDVRLMISKQFGFPSEQGMENQTILSGHTCQFTFLAETVSKCLNELYYPTVQPAKLRITPRCILGSGTKRSINGKPILVSTDPTQYAPAISMGPIQGGMGA